MERNELIKNIRKEYQIQYFANQHKSIFKDRSKNIKVKKNKRNKTKIPPDWRQYYFKGSCCKHYFILINPNCYKNEKPQVAEESFIKPKDGLFNWVIK